MAKTTKSASKKTKTDSTPAPAPVEVKQEVANTPVDVDTSTDDDLLAQTSAFVSKFQALSQAVSTLRTEFRTLEKAWTKTLKSAQKAGAKRKRKTGQRQPSGFVKPTLISDELANFLSKPSGTEMARTEVTREINKYIRAHNLQDKDNGRRINPDTSLTKLLKLKKGDELTYFNLQRYMSPHFAKQGQPKPAASM